MKEKTEQQPAQNPDYRLESEYQKAVEYLAKNKVANIDLLHQDLADLVDQLVSASEKAKGVFSVYLTSLFYKLLHPAQDIRNHQSSISQGYSGRTFDTKYVTPFLKAKKFPSMKENGWLTRSLEQKSPYTLDYKGAITPKEVKPVFLEAIDRIQNGANTEAMLQYTLQKMILLRDSSKIELAKPTDLPIANILNILVAHFNGKYSSEGASRLPSLALYAAYECLISETKRFQDKKLLNIVSHTSADKRSGRIGDIDVIDEKGRAFEAVEVKHGIPITPELVSDAYQKFQTTPVKRYYILSTSNEIKDEQKVNKLIADIKINHGCQVIANGVVPTLKYYLRLLENPYEFIERYVKLIEVDESIKFEHRIRWNQIISPPSEKAE